MKTTLAGWIVSYAVTAATMIVIDMLWLGVIAKPWYLEGIGHLMASKPNLVAAAVFYAMFPVGLMVFAVAPQADITKAAMWGAAFGVFTYATYDLTNLATLKAYPTSLALLDMAWGAAISAIAAAAGKWAHVRWLSEA
jgi:uncharacterized membrane protein